LNRLKVLLVQADVCWSDVEANRRYLESIVRQQGASCDVVVFTETFSSGFLGDTDATVETMQGETLQWMKALAQEFDCVLCGSLIIDTGSGLANRFLWVQPDGEVQYYDKRHLFAYGGEGQRYQAGAQRKIIDYRGWRISPQICYDLRFPAWCRNREDYDYDVLLFVANWPQPRTSAWSALLRARAIENQCYVIGVNRVGDDELGLHYAGSSAVYDPLGETVVDLGDEEGQAIAVLQLDVVSKLRQKLPFQADGDKYEFV